MDGALHVFGITLIGVTAANGRRRILTLAFMAAVILLGRGLSWAISRLTRRLKRAAFWSRQAVSMSTAGLLIVGVLSIWFEDPTRLATALGLVTAGLAFRTVSGARTSIGRSLTFYNGRRPRSSLDRMTPDQA